MSRWEPVSKSIQRQQQSDGCGKAMFGCIVFCLAGLLFAALLAWALQPRCWACNHPSHPQKMCGAYIEPLGTCICEKDKR